MCYSQSVSSQDAAASSHLAKNPKQFSCNLLLVQVEQSDGNSVFKLYLHTQWRRAVPWGFMCHVPTGMGNLETYGSYNQQPLEVQGVKHGL